MDDRNSEAQAVADYSKCPLPATHRRLAAWPFRSGSPLRIPRTKSGRPLSVPLNATALSTLQTLHDTRDEVSPYVFPHRSGPNAGEPVMDIKNGFHAALELAEIQDFTWHDLRHTFASWLMMRRASLRSGAELLGHPSMKMTMRYAHLSPAFLCAEVSLLDPPPPAPAPAKGRKSKRARKGQRASNDDQPRSEVPGFVREIGSPYWTIFATGSSVPRDAEASFS